MPTRRPVIAIAGLAIESSAFSPARSDAAAFHPRRGPDAVRLYPFLADDAPDDGNAGPPLATTAVWRGALVGRALPGGAVTRAAYEALATEICDRLKVLHEEETTTTTDGLDGLFFDIHGAMVVANDADEEGYTPLDDPESDLLKRIRAVIGPRPLVAAAMDLHGNVSRDLAHQCDLLTCYRRAPHDDELETKQRACRHLVHCLGRRAAAGQADDNSSGRPHKAWIPLPLLLPGEQTSTRDEPAASLYAEIPRILGENDTTTAAAATADTAVLLDAAIWVGYAWADAPRNRAAVVVTGWHVDAVAVAAERLARRFWAVRAQFHFAAPAASLPECLDVALAAVVHRGVRPFFVSDTGDNPTAGGAGDVPWGLRHLIAYLEEEDHHHSCAPLTVIYASLPAPQGVAAAVAAGLGASVSVLAGAQVDNRHGGPVALTGTVHAIKHGDPHAGTEVVLRVDIPPPPKNTKNTRNTARRRLFVILTARRKPYHHERDFTDLALDPRAADLVLVKIGYLEPELFAMAADWMLALTPGGVDQDLARLGHRRIRRPMFPFDTAFDPPPNLSARMLPLSTEPLTGPDE